MASKMAELTAKMKQERERSQWQSEIHKQNQERQRAIEPVRTDGALPERRKHLAPEAPPLPAPATKEADASGPQAIELRNGPAVSVPGVPKGWVPPGNDATKEEKAALMRALRQLRIHTRAAALGENKKTLDEIQGYQTKLANVRKRQRVVRYDSPEGIALEAEAEELRALMNNCGETFRRTMDGMERTMGTEQDG